MVKVEAVTMMGLEAEMPVAPFLTVKVSP